MSEHIERMKIELKELEEKLDKASEFLKKEILTPKYTNEIQRIRLSCQVEHMDRYKQILKERIEYDSNLEKRNKEFEII